MKRSTPTVYAFMDESGDPGSRNRKGASSHFILVLVETIEPEKLRTELKQLRVALYLPTAFEFRYHDTRSVERRAAFFVLLRSLDLGIRAAIVEKNRLPEVAERWREQEFYEYALGEIIKHSS